MGTMTAAEVPVYAIAILVDPRGWVLLQQRAADAAKQPSKWACIGGPIREGEGDEQAARRELATQAGLSTSGELQHWATEVFTWSTGTVAEYRTYVGATALTDAEVPGGVGQQVIFVDPAAVPGLDFTESGAHVLRGFLGSDVHRALQAAAARAG